jgi:hypothetical protein
VRWRRGCRRRATGAGVMVGEAISSGDRRKRQGWG